MAQFNRTFVLLGLMALAGWVAYLMANHSFVAGNAAMVLGTVSGPVAAYIGVKGGGSNGLVK